MSTSKHIDKICMGIILFSLLVTVWFMNGKAFGVSVISGEESNGGFFTENDQDGTWDTKNATKIVLSDDGSAINGTGAYVYGNDIHIIGAGEYVISGGLTNGKILVETERDDKIWLMFDGVSIHCEEDAAIRIEQAGKVFLTLRDGTENSVSSGAAYSEDAVSANVDGTIYSRDDLTINGSGSLNVTAEYQHGIVCNDDFIVTGGVIAVDAAQDGIHANESVRIKDADFTLSAADDGITVSNDDETAYFYMESGNIRIPSCYEGIEAVQVTIAGGTIDIVSSDDGINASGNSGNSAINISGGEVTIKNENGRDADGLDSNKDIFISGGKLLVSVGGSGGNNAIDYGSENGGVCKISGGTVLACGSNGMAEGFDSDSTQGFLMYSASAEAGTTVKIKDADGKELLCESVPCSFSSILASTPEMEIGSACTIAVGEQEEEITIDQSSNSGGFGWNPRKGGVMGQGQENRPEMGDAQPPELPGEADGDGAQPAAPPDSENFGGQPDGSMKMPGGRNRGDMPGDVPQTAGQEFSVSKENILLLGISAVVLLAGCTIAFFFRPKG